MNIFVYYNLDSSHAGRWVTRKSAMSDKRKKIVTIPIKTDHLKCTSAILLFSVMSLKTQIIKNNEKKPAAIIVGIEIIVDIMTSVFELRFIIYLFIYVNLFELIFISEKGQELILYGNINQTADATRKALPYTSVLNLDINCG